MRLPLWLMLPLVSSWPVIAHADPVERVITKLSMIATPQARPIDLWLSKTRNDDGGIIIKLTARSTTQKALSLTLYQGGGDDDGAGDADMRSLTMRPFDVPGGKRWVRVDFGYRIPDGGKKDERTETYLVDVSGRPRRLLEMMTQQVRLRSKLCREGEETQLLPETVEGETRLVAVTHKVADPALGDDDLPIDKSCKAPEGSARRVLRLTAEGFKSDAQKVEPAAKPAAPSAADSDDDED